MNEEFSRALRQQYEWLIEVADQTFEVMGVERASTFVEIINDWIDVNGAILSDYPKNNLLGSVVYVDFLGLFQQIRWLHILFLGGNYPMVFRNLRFVWELAFRAHHVDKYAFNHPDDPNPPGVTVDEKIEWLQDRERDLNWGNVIHPTLSSLLPKSAQNSGAGSYRDLWQQMNECVHPTKTIRDKMIEESTLLLADNFDENWANETLDAATQVFDLIWLTILDRFPNIKSSLDIEKSFRTSPLVRESF